MEPDPISTGQVLVKLSLELGQQFPAHLSVEDDYDSWTYAGNNVYPPGEDTSLVVVDLFDGIDGTTAYGCLD